MSTITPTTGQAEPAWSTESKPAMRGFMAGGVWMPGLAKNELGSTEREWAIKPPPGMESEPLDWDEITKL